jgi:hypothetical protein
MPVSACDDVAKVMQHVQICSISQDLTRSQTTLLKSLRTESPYFSHAQPSMGGHASAHRWVMIGLDLHQNEPMYPGALGATGPPPHDDCVQH